MIFLYNLLIQLYVAFIRLASLWNDKAREWIKGRSNLFSNLKNSISAGDRVIWIHSASAGELEQGKPVIEGLKKQYPTYKILLTFFSPSGYSVGKKYTVADVVTYLPIDTRNNAKQFIETVHPSLIVFVKYEYWYHHLSVAAFKHIPILLISAKFRREQLFFKWYGKFYRQLLFLYRHIFVQDKNSSQLLYEYAISHCSKSGDTRFDRVDEIAANFSEVKWIKEFCNGGPVIVAGSTWKDDEKFLGAFAQDHPDIKIIIAPHEVNKINRALFSALFKNVKFYSQLKNEKESANLKDTQVLVIDSIGLLSRLYQYATITYVGGGFNRSGIHNTLEAAVYGKPVIFGPNYKKFREANDLIERGGAFSISNEKDFSSVINNLLGNTGKLSDAGEAAKKYVSENRGATNLILQAIQEKRLLTN